MQSLKITLTLKDDVVLSESAATAGMHQSLDFIPGATLLGSMASQTYQTLFKNNQAWSVFHSGKVRFGNALPVQNNTLGYPMPLCLHNQKSNSKAYANLLWAKVEPGVQMKQMRAGYLTAQAQSFQPIKHYSMRTAIDAQTGTAAQSQLFGYEALRAGQIYETVISCDDDADHIAVKAFFTQGKILNIGRSRSAQFGRVEITAVQTVQLESQWQLKENKLILWLAADCVAHDDFGQPTLNPSGVNLGLSSGKLNLRKSFIRTRTICAFNGARQHYDLNRQAIAKGSVLVFDECELTEQDQAQLNAGLGLYREQGYGQVVPFEQAKTILIEPHPQIVKLTIQSATRNVSAPHNSILVKNLTGWLNEGEAVKVARQKADGLFKELLSHYQSARNFEGVAAGVPHGPSNSQWGRIRDLAQSHLEADKSEILIGLKDICKEADEAWKPQIGSGEDKETFGSWLLKQVQDDNNANSTDWLRILAHEASQSSYLASIRLGKAQEKQA